VPSSVEVGVHHGPGCRPSATARPAIGRHKDQVTTVESVVRNTHVRPGDPVGETYRVFRATATSPTGVMHDQNWALGMGDAEFSH
jgi:hypothetical protein